MIYSVGSDLESNCLTLKDFFEKKQQLLFKKKLSKRQQKHEKLPNMQRVKSKFMRPEFSFLVITSYFNIIL